MKKFFVLLIALTAHCGYASDYGCQVLMCLSNPAGPRAVAECIPPINQLFDDLIRGRAFPSCAMSSGSGGGSYATPGYGWYDSCPANTRALAYGAKAIKKGKQNSVFSGIGEGVEISNRTGAGDRESGYTVDYAPSKTCVGNLVGSTELGRWDDRITANIYTNVISLPPASTPRFIDVFVNGQVYRRVRW